MAAATSDPGDDAIRAHLDRLAKPPGSLGKLEDVAHALARCQGTLRPRTRPAHLALFAADHGVATAGVTAWPQAVTGALVRTIRAGRAVSSALARAHGVALSLVDVGTLDGSGPAPPPRTPGAAAAGPGVRFVDARVGPGTADLARADAMSVAAFERAFATGAAEADHAAAAGAALLIAGELGIGNTTAASAVTVLLTGCAVAAAVGPGASPPGDPRQEAIVARKRAVVERALQRVRGDARMDGANAPAAGTELRRALAALSGFELAAMAGYYVRGAERGLTLLLDGFVACAAALMAERLHPGTRLRMLAAHRSPEPGHALLLGALGLTPLLDWGMRLGEGTGALVALPLLDGAAALASDVAPLSEVVGGAGSA